MSGFLCGKLGYRNALANLGPSAQKAAMCGSATMETDFEVHFKRW
jgi:hypothetical protein